MPSVSKSIRISAAAQRVFGVITNPDNWTSYVGSLVDVYDRSSDIPAMGSTFGWTYRMMGFEIKGRGTVSVHEPDSKFVLVLDGRFPVRETYSLSPEGGSSTLLEVEIQYEMPEPMMMLLGETVTEKLNDIEAKGILEKIKTLCEDAPGIETSHGGGV